jgi:hypothetical protein
VNDGDGVGRVRRNFTPSGEVLVGDFDRRVSRARGALCLFGRVCVVAGRCLGHMAWTWPD